MDKNIIFYKTSEDMKEINNESIDLVVTSPPYFNVKDYSRKKTPRHKNDISYNGSFEVYIAKLLKVWKECEKKLKSNGKLCINVPLMPMPKKQFNNNHTRHLFDIKSEILISILRNTSLLLMDEYIWERTNSAKKLMFGSYPYPTNFYNQNIIEFIIILVKPGSPSTKPLEVKTNSKISQKEWVQFTKQIWRIPIPNKLDSAYGHHAALMPEEIARRLIKLYSFEGDIVLDPFLGSGTTAKVAKSLKRNYIGYEIYKIYQPIIDEKLS